MPRLSSQSDRRRPLRLETAATTGLRTAECGRDRPSGTSQSVGAGFAPSLPSWIPSFPTAWLRSMGRKPVCRSQGGVSYLKTFYVAWSKPVKSGRSKDAGSVLVQDGDLGDS